MKESAFRTSVLRHVPAHVHAQPMPAGALGAFPGTPDHYFDWKRDLWVEWKALNREDHLPASIPNDALPTEKQRAWLNRRFAAGGNAVVIVGVKLRSRMYGFVLESPSEWGSPGPLRAWYEPRLRSAAELAAYILERCK